jgi:hypothetical protein
MAFVNEMISEEDWDKYNLSNIDKRWGGGQLTEDWTIDRERGIWFRLYRSVGDIENSGAEVCTYWNFYWKGSLILVETKTLKKIPPATKNSGTFYCYIEILDIEIPKEIEQHKQEIFKDLKEAFEVSQMGLGVYIRDDEDIVCKVDLEYKGELI